MFKDRLYCLSIASSGLPAGQVWNVDFRCVTLFFVASGASAMVGFMAGGIRL